MEGPLLWPGQYAGFLGPKYDVMQVTNDPNRPDFRIDNLRPADGMNVDSLRDRVALLDAVNVQQKWLSESAETRKLSDQQKQALAESAPSLACCALKFETSPPHGARIGPRR